MFLQGMAKGVFRSRRWLRGYGHHLQREIARERARQILPQIRAILSTAAKEDRKRRHSLFANEQGKKGVASLVNAVVAPVVDQLSLTFDLSSGREACSIRDVGSMDPTGPKPRAPAPTARAIVVKALGVSEDDLRRSKPRSPRKKVGSTARM